MKYNFARFTDEANIALNSAIECAQELGHTYIGSEHLLLGIAKTECAANEILSDFDVTFEENISPKMRIDKNLRYDDLPMFAIYAKKSPLI